MGNGKVDQAIELVKDLIQSGSIRAGDRLPSEGDLAAQLGVSRNSLREAMRAMQTMRILEVRQGDGTYVSDLNPANSMDVLRFAVDISDTRSVVWYLEIRRLLEVSAAQEAAARCSDEDLAQLQEVHARLLAEDDGPGLMALDAEFHDILGRIGSNPIQAALLRVISAPTLRARVWRQRLAVDSCDRIRNEHQAILDAIAARDVDGARHAMWQHINQVILWVEGNPDSMAAGQTP
ncbi:FadR/GntR family transcriptional regulator [Antarctobacter sp.]|uniref:FadR/GntR family transcriptional regulator n=1 Tax=Antarctobacter sp. TaxID=1872577 RepID=UPI003A90D3D4